MSPALPGYVYFDPEFKFHDGTTGRKIFVVLCDSPLDDEYVVVTKTTSKPKSGASHGCYLDDFPPCFCFLNETSNFDAHTWIMLHEVYEYEKAGLERMKRTTDLSFEHTKELLHCASTCHYLTNWQTEAFQNELERLS